MSEKRERYFEVKIVERWLSDEERKEWKQLREPETTRDCKLDSDYGYISALLPTWQSRTRLEAALDELEVERVVQAIFNL